ncbi:hypothetical protein ScPMuIL_008382 [Solemya velum]
MLLAGYSVVFCGLALTCFTRTATSDSCQHGLPSREGDLKIVSVLGLRKSHRGGCEGVSPAGYQAAIALDWITGLLNGDGRNNTSFIPGINIGFEIYDDCGIEELAVDAVLQSRPIPSLSCSQSNPSTLTAGYIVGPNEESLIAVSNFVKPVGVFGFTTANEKTEGWGNILRPRSPIKSQSQVTLEVLDYLDSNFVGIVYTDDVYGIASFENFLEQANAAGVCVAMFSHIPGPLADDNEVNDSLEKVVSNIREKQFKAEESSFIVLYFGDARSAVLLLKFLKKSASDDLYKTDKLIHLIFPPSVSREPEFQSMLGEEISNIIITISTEATAFEEFQDFHQAMVSDTNNTWLHDYIQTQRGIFSQDDSVNVIVNSVFSLAETLRRKQREVCGNSATLCERLVEEIVNGLRYDSEVEYASIPKYFVPENLQTQSFQFDSAGFVKPIFKITHHSTKDSTIGSFENNKLVVNSFSKKPSTSSRCAKICDECSEISQKKLVYVEGEVLILGVFSIRSKGTGKFQCGEYRNSESSIAAAVSFLEGVKSLKRQTGIPFGAIAFDDCYNSLYSLSFLADLFSGKEMFVDRKTEKAIEPSKIVAVVGALTSQVTLGIVELLTPLGIPLVSYGASASWLDDRNKYPYFLRTVPSDTLQVEAMLSVLKNFNFTHVGGVNINDAYGKNGISELKSQAESSGICFERPNSVSESGDDNQVFDNTIRALKIVLAKVVVFFGMDTTAEILLNKVRDNFENEGFLFVASEAWGHSSYLLQDGRGDGCKGSIVLNVQTVEESSESFKEYLQNSSPLSIKNDIWLKHLWEHLMQCDFLTTFSHSHRRICSLTGVLPRADIDRLGKDQRRVHTMHAVRAIVQSVQNLQRNGLVDYLRDHPQEFIDEIRQSSITLTNGKPFKPFGADGNGNIGFTINNVQENRGQYQYIEIGSFDEDNKLTLHPKLVNFYKFNDADFSCKSKSTCSYLASCREGGPPVTTIPASDTTIPGEDVSPYLSAVIVLIVFTVILITAVVIMVIYVLRRKHKKAATLENKTTSVASRLSGVGGIYDEPHCTDSIFDGLDNEVFEHSSVSSGRRTISIPNGLFRTSEAGTPIQYSGFNHDGTAIISLKSSPATPRVCTPEYSRRMSPNSPGNRSASTGRLSDNISPIRSPDRAQNPSTVLVKHGRKNITYITAKDLDIHEEEEGEDGEEVDADGNSSPYTDMSLGNNRMPTDNATYFLGALAEPASQDSPGTLKRPDWLPLKSQLPKEQDNYVNSPTSLTTPKNHDIPKALVPDVIMHEHSGENNMAVYI